ncbi:SDR family oxidoreductase [Aestuariibius sp. HNIBRBA575]|uniref:SDR family oxidoreductase n=1 Tax=Aestuariibius sp. HNIBRBA575 TaxID=3233343 RepID=UPI0034A34AE2
MSDILLSFGHGYSARAIADLVIPHGWHVIGTTRNPDNIDAILDQGASPVQWPGADLTSILDVATHLLISAAPGPDGDPVLNDLREEIAARRDRFEWVGYLSTTGVYGDHQGSWVDENTPLTPSTKRGEMRVKAEADWAALDLPLHIFRLAGIYGPGRGPFAKVRNGTARCIVKPDQVFSRIHVDDIAQTVAASMLNPNPGAIYNLCDDDPAPPQDVIAYAAELLGQTPPPSEDFATADMTPMARSFYAENKKVRNTRIKEELGIELRYPDYKSGLTALLNAENDA